MKIILALVLALTACAVNQASRRVPGAPVAGDRPNIIGTIGTPTHGGTGTP